MPIQFDNFDQQKIDRLKNHLIAMAEKEKPKQYEIFVDALRAVPKTDEPNDFDGYETYLTPDSEQIKILIYNSVSSPRNDQYVFLLKARNREEAVIQGLNGMAVQSFTKSSLSDWREKNDKKTAEIMEIQNLKKEIQDLKEELEESEEYIEELEKTVEDAKANGNKIGGVNISEVMSAALEGIIRRNTHLLTQIPGASGLAGIIEQDNQRLTKQLPQADTEVSFKKKDSGSSSADALSEQEKQFVALFNELQKHFNEVELNTVMAILEWFSKDKSRLQTVSELISDNK